MTKKTKKDPQNEIPQAVQFKLALDYLYRQATVEGWDLTANLIGAASDSVVHEYYQSMDEDNLASPSQPFFIPDEVGTKPN